MAMKLHGGPRSASTSCQSLSSCGGGRATRSFSRNLEFDVRASSAAMALLTSPGLDSCLLDGGDGGLEHTTVERIAVGSALWRAGQDHRWAGDRGGDRDPAAELGERNCRSYADALDKATRSGASC